MGVRRFLAFLRQKSTHAWPLLAALPNDSLRNASVAIDANNYFYKFLNTEPQGAADIEQSFCALTCGTHDTVTLTLINEHLMHCETSSERHLLRCLYVFCRFLHTTLQIRHALFVLDGAAPPMKTGELMERKQQKQIAHSNVLNERRALLLHRIYVLRWYQTLCLSLALLRNLSTCDNFDVSPWRQTTPQQTRQKESREQQTRSKERPQSPLLRTPCHVALYRLLLNVFEWALATEMPERLFNRAAEATFLARLDVADVSMLTSVFLRMRMNVQTSFLVELDYLCNTSDGKTVDQRASLLRNVTVLVESLLDAMIETDFQTTDANETPRPFLVCIHIGSQYRDSLSPLLRQRKCEIERCWQRCCAAFLVCGVVHNETAEPDFFFPESFCNAQPTTAKSTPQTTELNFKTTSTKRTRTASPTLTTDVASATETAAAVAAPVPTTAGATPSAAETTATSNAANAFAHWEKSAEQYWCDRQNFAHEHRHVWRSFAYAQWLCCEKSGEWLRAAQAKPTPTAMAAAVMAAPATATATATTTAMAGPALTISESQKLMRFYCNNGVPVSFGGVYDTLNDESHKNLVWNKKTCALFESQQTRLTTGVASTTAVALCQFVREFFTRRQRRSGVKRAMPPATSTLLSSAQVDEKKPRLGQHVNESCDATNLAPPNVGVAPTRTTTTTTAQSFGETEHHQRLALRLDEKHQLHVRHRIRDAYLQVVIHFLRVVCGVQMLVAEHEAEATCAKLCRDGIVNYVFTDDVDALAFGAPNIVVDWPSIGEIGKSLLLLGGTLRPAFCAKIIHRHAVLQHFALEMDRFTMWCILCGTDFAPLNVAATPLFSVSIHEVLHIVRTRANVYECADAFLQQQRRSTKAETASDICALIEHAYRFFVNNQTDPQSEFLLRQFAPHSIDETVHLQTICAGRKMVTVVE